MDRLTGSAAYRRSGSTWESDAGGHEERGITCDANGNVLTMQRTAGGVLVDDLSYTYAGNRLAGVTESAAPAGGEDVYARGDSSRGTYEHDANGNMIKDSRNALIYRYNVLNLLRGVETGSGEPVASYAWLPDGSKLRVRTGDVGNGFDYLGSLTIVQDNAGARLESVRTVPGAILVSAGGEQEVTYHLTDHLGSVRAIVDGSGSVLERNDYYPFGSRHPRADNPQSGNRHKYNGKEEQRWVGQCYLDYGWRMYNAALCRWHAMDPLAEESYSLSGYAYCSCDPVNRIDPDGALDDGWLYDLTTNEKEWYSSIGGSEYNLIFPVLPGPDGSWLQAGDAVVLTGDMARYYFTAFVSGVIISTVNYGEYMKDDLVGYNGYRYDLADLRLRRKILDGPSHHLRAYLMRLESKGWAEPLTTNNFWKTYGSTQGNLVLFESYASSAFSLTAGAGRKVNLSQNRQYHYLKQFTHASSRMLSRGITSKAIKDALENPLSVRKSKKGADGRYSQVYIGREVTVVKNPHTNKIITCYKTKSRILRKYMRNGNN